MLERITNLCQDRYCVRKARTWMKYKSDGAFKAVCNYLLYSAIGMRTTFCEYWNFRMRDADLEINREINLSEEQES